MKIILILTILAIIGIFCFIRYLYYRKFIKSGFKKGDSVMINSEIAKKIKKANKNRLTLE